MCTRPICQIFAALQSDWSDCRTAVANGSKDGVNVMLSRDDRFPSGEEVLDRKAMRYASKVFVRVVAIVVKAMDGMESPRAHKTSC